jgi:D-threo-aldose 1-dehydrogenase
LLRRPVARTGFDVTVVGLGAAPLGDLYGLVGEATAAATLDRALACGINLVDVAPLYGHGLAELRCGSALRRALAGRSREELVVSSKVGRWMNPMARPALAGVSGYVGALPHAAVIDYSYDGTLRSLEQSLLRLGMDRIDIVLIHDVDAWTHGADAVEARFAEAMDGAYRALTRLRAEGVVRAIGVGVNDSEMCERFAVAGDFDVMLLAGRYSLLEQPALVSFLPLAERMGIAVLLGGIFNSGILATGAVPGARYNYGVAPPEILQRVEHIERVCRSHRVALADAALQFALGHPAVTSIVLGVVKPEEVDRNLAALRAPIPAALWADLKAQGLLNPEAPTPGVVG